MYNGVPATIKVGYAVSKLFNMFKKYALKTSEAGGMAGLKTGGVGGCKNYFFKINKFLKIRKFTRGSGTGGTGGNGGRTTWPGFLPKQPSKLLRNIKLSIKI